MKPTALLLDIDKTLTNTQREISGRTKQALRETFSRGLKVGLCTGRPYAVIVTEILPLFPDDALHILSGGGQVTHSSGKVLWSKELPSEMVRDIYDHVTKFGGVCGFGIGENYYGTPKLIEKMKLHHWRVNLQVPNSLENWQTPYVFVSKLNKKIREHIASLPGVSIKEMINYSGEHYYDVTPEGVNKAVAAEEWAKLQGVFLKDVIAVGDGMNDLEVLQAVGHGVAMGNAIPELKSIAQEIIGHTDDDGLAQYLEGLQ